MTCGEAKDERKVISICIEKRGEARKNVTGNNCEQKCLSVHGG